MIERGLSRSKAGVIEQGIRDKISDLRQCPVLLIDSIKDFAWWIRHPLRAAQVSQVRDSARYHYDRYGKVDPIINMSLRKIDHYLKST